MPDHSVIIRNLASEFWSAALVEVWRCIRTLPHKEAWHVGLRDSAAGSEMTISTDRWTVAVQSASYQHARARAGGWSVRFRFDAPPPQRVSLPAPDERNLALPLRAQLFTREHPGIWPNRSVGLLWRGGRDTPRLVRVLMCLHADRGIVGDYELEPGVPCRLDDSSARTSSPGSRSHVFRHSGRAGRSPRV